MTLLGARWWRLFAGMLAGALAHCGARVAPPVTDRPVRLLAAGVGQMCAVDARDGVWCWGFVGGGDEFAARPPTLLDTLAGVDELVPGQASVCVRTADGRVLCAGSSAYGQLGADVADRATFAPVSGVEGVAQLVYSRGRYCALQRDGGVRCWGAALHVSADRARWRTLVHAVTAVETGGPARRLIVSDRLCVERRSGELACESADGMAEPAVVVPLAPIEADNVEPIVGANGERCERTANALRCATTVIEGLPPGLRPLFVTSNGAGMCGALDGAMLCKNPGQDRRLAALRPSRFAGWSEAELPRFTAIAANVEAVCAVATDGRPFCWGSDALGGLGQGLPRYSATARRVSLGDAPARRLLSVYPVVASDREIVRVRGATTSVEDELRDPARDPFAADRLQREVLLDGDVFTDVVSITPTVCAFGSRTRCRGDGGRISEPFGDDGATTRSLSFDHSGLARIRRDGRVEIVFSPLPLDRVEPLLLPFTDAVSVSVDLHRVCAVDTGNVLRCVGSDFPGTTDRPPTAPPAVLATDARTIQQFSEATCYIDTRGRPFCWGQRSAWLFDPDAYEDVPAPRRIEFDRPVRALSLWAGVILALGEDGRVYCRGNNGFGQCGRRSSARRVEWAQVEGVDDVVAVQVLGGQSCAIRSDGALFCWGAMVGPDATFGHDPRSDRAVYVELRARP